MKRRILVVDDDAQIREMLRRKLDQCGYDVGVASNGVEAIETLEKDRYDLVIADILMPEKDGLEVIMFLQREQPHVKCVAISAPSNRVFLQSAELLGATSVLEKPFELKEVADLVARLLST